MRVLGTRTGIPIKDRNITSLILELQAIHNALWMIPKLEKVFITHLHGDHIFGLPGLWCSRSMGGPTAPLALYGPKGIRQFVEEHDKHCTCAQKPNQDGVPRGP